MEKTQTMKTEMNDWTEAVGAQPIATPARYEEALIQMRNCGGVANYELAIFNAFSLAPRHTLTASELARECGFTDKNEANLRFGQLAKRVSEALHFMPRSRHGDGEPRWWPTLAYAPNQEGDSEGHWQWTMRPELLEVLRAMRWVRVAQ